MARADPRKEPCSGHDNVIGGVRQSDIGDAEKVFENL